MKAVILAGGLGSRLSEETGTKPKPLVEVGGMPIIWHIMKIYAANGVRDFIVCAGYKGYMLKQYFLNLRTFHADLTIDLSDGSVHWLDTDPIDWRVTVVDTGHDTMTGGRLKRIRRFLDPDEPFCMTYGDGVGDIDIAATIEQWRASEEDALVTVVKPPGRFGAVSLEGEKVLEFVEKPTGGDGLINGGFFVLHPRVLDLVEGDGTVWEKGPLEQLAREGRLCAYRHTGYWQPMDTLRDRTTLEALWTAGDAPWKIW